MPLAITAVLAVAFLIYRQHQKDSTPVEPGPYSTPTIKAQTPVQNSKPRQVIHRRTVVRRGGGDRQGLGGHVDPNDFARGFSVKGYTTAQLIALARAQAPHYNGVRYVPHNIAQEGQVIEKNGHKYIRVKYSSPTGRGANSTEDVRVG